MPKFNLSKEEEELQVSMENVRITRATARRLGSAERDLPGSRPGTPLKSTISLSTISEDTSPKAQGNAQKKQSPSTPIKEKAMDFGTPRRTRRTSLLESNTPKTPNSRHFALSQDNHKIPEEAFLTLSANNRSTRGVKKTASTSNLDLMNTENRNGGGSDDKSPRNVTFDESPETSKEHTKFPKTPRAEGKKTSQEASDLDSSLENKIESSQNESKEEMNDSVTKTDDGSSSSEKKKRDNRTIARNKDGESSSPKVHENEAMLKKFTQNWVQPVTGKVKQNGQSPIDGFKTKSIDEIKPKETSIKVKSPQKNKECTVLVDSASDDDYEEEETDSTKLELIDDQALEVSGDEESMDEEEREYLRQQEIPDDGESIGTEDSDHDDQDEEECVEDDFIVASDHDDLSVESADSLDDLEEKAEKIDKTRRRIKQISESSDDDEVFKVEAYKSTALTKFTGTAALNLADDAEYTAQDVTMVSLPSPTKKTPKNTPTVVKGSARKSINLFDRSSRQDRDSPQKTPQKSSSETLSQNIPDNDNNDEEKESSDSKEEDPEAPPKQKTPERSFKKTPQKETTPGNQSISKDLEKNQVDSSDSENEERNLEEEENTEISSRPEEAKDIENDESDSETQKKHETKKTPQKAADGSGSDDSEQESPDPAPSKERESDDEISDSDTFKKDQEASKEPVSACNSKEIEDTESEEELSENIESEGEEEVLNSSQKSKQKEENSTEVSALLARCDDFIRERKAKKLAQKKKNEEKRAKRREAKQRKQLKKKELEEKRVALEKTREEVRELKQREKEAPKTKEEKISKVPESVAKKSKNKASVQENSKQEIEAGKMNKVSEVEKTTKKRKMDGDALTTKPHEDQEKTKKKESRVQDLAQEPPKKKKKEKITSEEKSSEQSKRLPLALLNQLQDGANNKSQSKSQKRRAEKDEHGGPVKKHKSSLPKIVDTEVGKFVVTDVGKNPFGISDASLIRKSQVTKRYKKEKKLKQIKKQIPENSSIFPRAGAAAPTFTWTASGVFTVTDFGKPKTKIVSAGPGVQFQFNVTSLEHKNEISKKSSSTSVFGRSDQKHLNFKEAKLYGSSTRRETSQDLVGRKEKKKASNMSK